MLPAIVSTILLLGFAAAATGYIRSYRPARVPVVERARIPQDVRAKVSTGAKLRLHRQHRTGRNITARTGLTTAVTAPPARVNAPRPAALIPAFAGATPAAATPAPMMVQATLSHNHDGAPRPGSYFRAVDAPSPETITSEVRGPWAAKIVTGDGRITLPDNGMDVAVTWSPREDTPPAGAYLS